MIAPITSLYAALFGIFIAFLGFNVSKLRIKGRVNAGWDSDDALHRAVRVHGNAIEYVPITLLLMLTLELNTHREWLINAFGSMFLLARLLHALALSNSLGPSLGRFVGAVLTYVIILGLAIVNLLFYPQFAIL